jgi:hypothetical protein
VYSLRIVSVETPPPCRIAIFLEQGSIMGMTPEQSKNVIQIYEEAIAKIKELGLERQAIIKQYIKELEDKKIEILRNSLNNNQ